MRAASSPRSTASAERPGRLADHQAEGYLARQTGGRFSANAVAPSRASSEPNTGPEISACFCHCSSSAQPGASTRIRFDAAVARAAELGGRALVGVHDRPPFRSAVLADPEGAAFSVSQPPA